MINNMHNICILINQTEARAGCGLNILKKICICNIHGILSIFMWKKPYLTMIVMKQG